MRVAEVLSAAVPVIPYEASSGRDPGKPMPIPNHTRADLACGKAIDFSDSVEVEDREDLILRS